MDTAARNTHTPQENVGQHPHKTSEVPAYGGELIPYEEEYVKLNSKLQMAWGESIEKNVYTNTTAYRKVEVLMLSWEPKLDDLHVQVEIDDLQEVFENQFNFHVTRKCLERVEKKKTQNQINKIVADWVFEHDGRKTLLIVYFAGHGRPSKTGGLEIAGQKSPSDLRTRLDKVVWNRTESILQGIDADVLQIFDCCFAGTIETRGSASGASEFLAATGPDDTTPKPGKHSFTSALIWALKALLTESNRFTTSDLTSKIRKAPNFPPNQMPVLYKRGGDGFGEQQLIVLRPLLEQSEESPKSPNSRDATLPDDIGHDVLTLKFVFATRPDESDIRKLGYDMNHVIIGNDLKINRIVFAGVRSKRDDMMFKAISKFRAMGRRFAKGETTTAAANLLQNIEAEVEEHVMDRIIDHSCNQLEGSRRDFEAHTSAVRSRGRES